MRTKTLRLEDEIEEIEGEVIPELEELHEEIVEEAREACDSKAEASEFVQRNEQVKQQIGFYKELVSRFEEWTNENPDARFEVRELTAHEKAQVEDEARDASFELDQQTGQFRGTPRQGYARILEAQHSVVHIPDVSEAPDSPEDIGELPTNVFDWLHDEIDSLNTGTAEVDLSDYSLEKAFSDSGN